MDEMGKVKRIEYLDLLKAIAIMTVTFAHILGGFEKDLVSMCMLKFCYAIELPLFFIVSGVQHSLSTNHVNLKRKATRIMYPYITFSCFYILFDLAIVLTKYFVKGSLDFQIIGFDFIDFITTWGIGPLWFLPTIMLSEIVFIWLKEYKIISIVLSFLGVCLGYFLEGYYGSFLTHTASINIFIICIIARVLVAYSFVIIGYYGFSFVNIVARKIEKKTMRAYIGYSVLSVGGEIALLNSKIVDLHFAYCRNPFVTYASAILMFVGIFLICYEKKSKVLSYIGRHTLEYMGLQIGTGYLAKISIVVLCGLGFRVNSVLTAIVCFGVFMLGSSFLVWFLNNKAKWILNMEELRRHET